ncbi:thioesterase II family protein [Actinoplanes sp. NPDC020271]|uniref:thioesterase II family protein n=1 Tax=Actinoplanes sp. NPDC020271 TaxID=3363896 RepID=UPI0037B2CE3D
MRRLSSSLFSLGSDPDPAVPTVVQFGFAGAGVHSLREFQRLLPGRQHLAVNYPGRGIRSAEPPAPDVRAIATAVAEEFAGLLAAGVVAPGPLLIGHSMGAYVALETTALLESRGVPCTALVVSSSLPPGDGARRQTLAGHVVADLDDEELTGVLLAEGGLPEEILSEPELLGLILPVLRHDFGLGAAYSSAGDAAAVVACPLVAFAGEQDRSVTPEDMHDWRHSTRGLSVARTFPGDHFWFRSCPPGVGEAVEQAVSRVTG